MSAFTDANMPGSPVMSAKAQIEYEKAYSLMRGELSGHVTEKTGVNDADPHGTKAYVDAQVTTVKSNANTAKSLAERLERIFIGDKEHDAAGFGQTVEQYAKKKLDNQSVLQFITTLVDRMETLEKEYNKLSLLQFDNVPVGAGIRWWKDTLPEDGTYVWAEGQTLYGVNQNFPDLARAWEIGSADNVKVPKEDHTIFKVRKADRKISAIQHAYIESANGEVPTTLADTAAAVNDLVGRLATLQTAITALQSAQQGD